MAKITFEGLGDLEKQLNNILERANSANGKNVPFNTLFNKSFMKKYTKFLSFNEFLKAGDITATTNEEFDAIPESELNTLVSKHTNFKSWKEMQEKAAEIYVKVKLDL